MLPCVGCQLAEAGVPQGGLRVWAPTCGVERQRRVARRFRRPSASPIPPVTSRGAQTTATRAVRSASRSRALGAALPARRRAAGPGRWRSRGGSGQRSPSSTSSGAGRTPSATCSRASTRATSRSTSGGGSSSTPASGTCARRTSGTRSPRSSSPRASSSAGSPGSSATPTGGHGPPLRQVVRRRRLPGAAGASAGRAAAGLPGEPAESPHSPLTSEDSPPVPSRNCIGFARASWWAARESNPEPTG